MPIYVFFLILPTGLYVGCYDQYFKRFKQYQYQYLGCRLNNTNTNTWEIVLAIPIPIPIQLKNPIPIPLTILLVSSGELGQPKSVRGDAS